MIVFLDIKLQQIMKSLLAAALFMVAATHAADWKPDHPVEVIVGTAAGSGSDATARLVQRLLQEKRLVERPSMVLNKVGGGGVIAATYMVQHAGSGNHIYVTSPTLLTNNIMGKTAINYTQFTPLAQIGTEYVAFAVAADSPLKTGKDLAARLRQDGGGVSFALANALGNHNHIAIAQLAGAVGADVKKLRVAVFASSSEVTTALLGGHVDVAASPGSAVFQHVQSGKLRVLAVAAEQRQTGALSSVPTWGEQGVKVVSSNWRSVVGPQGMTVAQVQYWDGVFAKLVQQDEWKKDVAAKQFENTYLNSADTRRLMEAQYAELTVALRALGLARQAP
jgi:putative tricarboxylic transport membrane protein